MIIVRLKGGLGNQMFQYALGRALAIDRNVPLRLDTSTLASGPQRRTFELRHLAIDASVATASEIAAFRPESLKGILRLITDRLRPFHRRYVITERTHSFDADVLQAGSETYLQGYWQTERYFLRHAPSILQELQVRHPLEGRNLETARIISSVDSVAVHVRRGDYVALPEVAQRHGVCPPAYYERASALLRERVPRPHYFVFSDAIDWAREHLRFDAPTTYVAQNANPGDPRELDTSYEDIRLMSLCRHHIIANSTFSWWGAWLSRHPGKTVLAPRPWAIDRALDTPDIVPAAWIRVATIT